MDLEGTLYRENGILHIGQSKLQLQDKAGGLGSRHTFPLDFSPEMELPQYTYTYRNGKLETLAYSHIKLSNHHYYHPELRSELR
jgi:hypothetical protein